MKLFLVTYAIFSVILLWFGIQIIKIEEWESKKHRTYYVIALVLNGIIVWIIASTMINTNYLSAKIIISILLFALSVFFDVKTKKTPFSLSFQALLGGFCIALATAVISMILLMNNQFFSI